MGQYYGSKIATEGLVVHIDAANSKCYPGTGLSFTNLAKGYSDININLFGDTNNYGQVIDGTIELGGGSGNTSEGTALIGYLDLTSTVNTSFTSSAWMYFTSSSSAEIISYRQSHRRLSTYVTSSGMYFTQRREVTPFDTESTGVTVSNPLNEWAHFCVTKSGNTFNFYKNGVLEGTTTFSLLETVAANGAFHVGIAWSDDDYMSKVMEGKVGPVMHYKRSLSDNEVLQNFEAAKGRFGL